MVSLYGSIHTTWHGTALNKRKGRSKTTIIGPEVGEVVNDERPEARDLPASGARLTQRIKPTLEATFRSLRIPNFRRFFFGQLVSQTGTWMQTLAVVWLSLDPPIGFR